MKNIKHRTLADGRKTTRYWGSEAEARRLGGIGLVCIFACHVKPGDRIVSRPTMFGFAHGTLELQTVTAVNHDDDLGCVTIDTAMTSAQEDQELPVWIADPSDTRTYELAEAVRMLVLR